MIFDSDDFGANHVISDQCQSHDCRDVLVELKKINPEFKATLFAIPGEMTMELLNWCEVNHEWIELGVHGFYHTSNYECAEMTYEQFMMSMDSVWLGGVINRMARLGRGFKAPGWQISDDIYRWLLDRGWWVADQDYNDERRPKGLKVYKVGENSVHTHCWNCVGNGVYELFDELKQKVADNKEWRFVSEVL